MGETIISWANQTWNPVTGCTKISAGCANCYAERLSLMRGWSTKPWTKGNEADTIKLHPERLGKLRAIKKPSRIFVNSMSDMFHESVPDSFLSEIFDTMIFYPQHTFQILTKRPERAATWPGPWASNIWLGTSIENKRALPRLDDLKRSKAARKFVSFEPLLEDIEHFDATGIDWVIVGGESGPGYRPMEHSWARRIRDICVEESVAFFFKQSAAARTEIGTSLRESDGSEWFWQQYPGSLINPVMTKAAPKAS